MFCQGWSCDKCFGKVNTRGLGNLGELGQGVPLVWTCSIWWFQRCSEMLIFGPGPAYPRYHQRLLFKPLQAQVVVDWSKVPCVLMYCVCAATFSQSSWSIDLATSPWTSSYQVRNVTFPCPFLSFWHSCLFKRNIWQLCFLGVQGPCGTGMP
jgi:hypothetical protein